MVFGYAGKILWVDLSTGKIMTEPTQKYAQEFLGGRGVNVKILYDETTPYTHPFDGGNPLIFGVGPLVGTSPLCSVRTEVTAKSPQLIAGFLGQSNFGGHFGTELKFAGFDHVVIKGISSKPVYLWINNEEVELRDAKGVWGKGGVETQTLIQEELGDEDIKVAAIGLAGENRVVFACIVHQTSDGAGRTGLGAVMGSKNLKAVAVRGTGSLEVADSKKLLEEAQKAHDHITSASSYEELSTYGWSSLIEEYLKIGFGVVGNYEMGYWEPLAKYGRGQPFVDKYAVKSVGCQGCPVRCMHFFDVPDIGQGVTSCMSYVSLTCPIWNHDTRFMFELSQLGNHYGMDWISLGGIIGWLMELYTRGIIDEKDTGSIAVERGNRDAILKLTHMIAKREGIGDILAEGLLGAAKRIGRESEKYAMHTRGMDKHPYEFRAFHGYALATAIASRGDCIRINPVFEYTLNTEENRRRAIAILGKEIGEKAVLPLEYEGKAEMVRYLENATIVVDCLSFCKQVIPYHIESSINIPLKLYNTITGDSKTISKFLTIAEKIRNLERAFEAKNGLTRRNDSLPERFFTEPVREGPVKGAVINEKKFEIMKDEYYRLRGWDLKTGNPTKKRLEELSLTYVADDLDKYGKLAS